MKNNTGALFFSKGFKIALIIIFLVVLVFWLSLQKSSGKGEAIYKQNCLSCHGEDGKGLKKLIPPLAASDYLVRNKKMLPCIIRKGMKDSIVVNGQLYYQLMPPNNKLNEVDLTNLINYINSRWNEDDFVNPEEVKGMLENCE